MISRSNPGYIDVRRDFAGIRIAAYELWVESFCDREVTQLLQGVTAEHAEHVLETVAKGTPPRSISRGYYLWAEYLMWLKQVAELPGARIALMADEAEGLLAILQAEQKFRREHPPCWKCGELNEAFAGFCRACAAELK